MNFFRIIRERPRETMINRSSVGGNSRECSDALSVLDDAKNDSTHYIRRACHAGSWYSSDPIVLDSLLTKFLADAKDDKGNDEFASASALAIGRSVPNACISPHAGFQYSGATAAYSYLALAEAIQKNSLLGTVVVVSCMACVFASHPAWISFTARWFFFVDSPVASYSHGWLRCVRWGPCKELLSYSWLCNVTQTPDGKSLNFSLTARERIITVMLRRFQNRDTVGKHECRCQS